MYVRLNDKAPSANKGLAVSSESPFPEHDPRPVRRVAAVHDFANFCKKLPSRTRLAIDTEFIAEDSYQPNLCLVQVAFDDELVVIDPFPLGSVRRFWEAIVQGGVEVVVHAGKVDLQFCRDATGQFPARVFDVQIAAGFLGFDYPAGLANILQKYLRTSVTKHETRTDWRRRPLSDRQIEYALNDVRYLLALRDVLEAELRAMGRLEWFYEEVKRQQEESQVEDGTQWRRVAGAAGLGRRELAIVKALWLWREEEAARRNVPARRVLRDDLLIELARRGSADPKRIYAVRGMTHQGIRRLVPLIAARIKNALDLPHEAWPEPNPRSGSSQSPIVGQFLYSALSSLCRERRIAVGLVGGTNDIRDWLSYKVSGEDRAQPLLARGWRAELIGDLLERLVSGQVALRIRDHSGDNPLELIVMSDEATTLEPPSLAAKNASTCSPCTSSMEEKDTSPVTTNGAQSPATANAGNGEESRARPDEVSTQIDAMQETQTLESSEAS